MVATLSTAKLEWGADNHSFSLDKSRASIMWCSDEFFGLHAMQKDESRAVFSLNRDDLGSEGVEMYQGM